MTDSSLLDNALRSTYAMQGQYAGAQFAGQQAPINFAGQPQFASQQYYAPEKKEGSIFSFRNLLIAGTLAVGAVAAHKTSSIGKEFNALKKASNGAVQGEYKFGKNFLHNANPLNWLGNAETAKAAETAGLTKIEKSGRFFQHEGDTVQISGNKIRNLDGKVNDDATKLLTPAKAVKADAATSASKVSKRTPETLDDNINMAKTKVGKLDDKITKIEKAIKDTKAFNGNADALEAKLLLAKQAKCIQKIEVLEAQKLKLLSNNAPEAEIKVIESAIKSKCTYGKNDLGIEATHTQHAIEARLNANKAYRENQILMNKENGLAPTEYEQAYVKYDGKGLFKDADGIKDSKFINSSSDEVDIAIKGASDKLSYQDALNNKTTFNKDKAADRATKAAIAEKQTIQEQLKALKLIKEKAVLKNYSEKDVAFIQQLVGEKLPEVKISRVSGNIQISQTIARIEYKATGNEAMEILKQKLAAA